MRPAPFKIPNPKNQIFSHDILPAERNKNDTEGDLPMSENLTPAQRRIVEVFRDFHGGDITCPTVEEARKKFIESYADLEECFGEKYFAEKISSLYEHHSRVSLMELTNWDKMVEEEDSQNKEVEGVFEEFKKGVGGRILKMAGLDISQLQSFADLSGFVHTNAPDSIEILQQAHSWMSTGERPIIEAVLWAAGFAIQADELSNGATYNRLSRMDVDHRAAYFAIMTSS